MYFLKKSRLPKYPIGKRYANPNTLLVTHAQYYAVKRHPAFSYTAPQPPDKPTPASASGQTGFQAVFALGGWRDPKFGLYTRWRGLAFWLPPARFWTPPYPPAKGWTSRFGCRKPALEHEKVAFAGLDVFQGEPTPSIRILMHPRISLTPHIGAATTEAQDRIGNELAQQIIQIFGK